LKLGYRLLEISVAPNDEDAFRWLPICDLDDVKYEFGGWLLSKVK
jgi:hypothetical protein